MTRATRITAWITRLAGHRIPHRRGLGLAKPPRPPQHLRTRRDRRELARRPRVSPPTSWAPRDPLRNRPRSTRTVALAYAIAGVETPQALLLLELGQSLLGGFLVLGVLRLARTIAPDRPGLALSAALVTALHPTLVYAATHVQVASLGTTLLIWTLAAAYRTGTSRTLP